MRKKLRWLTAGIVLLLAIGVTFLLSESEPYHPVLSKYPIVGKGWTKDGHRFYVLKGDFEAIFADADAEVTDPDAFYSDVGTVTPDEKWVHYRARGTDDMAVCVSNDLSGQSFVYEFNSNIDTAEPELRPGYCAISFRSRPSLWGRFVNSVRGFWH